MSDSIKDQVYQFLLKLAAEYEKLEDERLYLVNEAQNRITEIQAQKSEYITEAQNQLDRLNVLRVADGEAELTLQEVRDIAKRRPGPRG